MRSAIRNLLIWAPAALVSMGAQHVHAQSTWTLQSGSGCTQPAPTGSYGNSWECTGAGTAGSKLNASAWANDRGLNTYAYAGTNSGASTSYTTIYRPSATAGRHDYTTYTNSNGTVYQSGTAVTLSDTRKTASVLQAQVAPAETGTWFANAYMSPQGTSGFGAASRLEGVPVTSPNHAFDSTTPGTADMVLLSFDAAVILQQFKFGWVGSDSDVSILRWTGDAGPTKADSATVPVVGDKDNLTGALASAGTAGWELVGHYGDVGTTTRETSAKLASSWWLISTYNTTLFGSGACTDFNTSNAENCDPADDAFKLNFLKTANYTCPSGSLTPGGSCYSAPPPGVPEPGTLALAAVAFVGLTVSRRRLKSSR